MGAPQTLTVQIALHSSTINKYNLIFTNDDNTNDIDVSYAIDAANTSSFLGRFEIAVEIYLEDLA